MYGTLIKILKFCVAEVIYTSVINFRSESIISNKLICFLTLLQEYLKTTSCLLVEMKGVQLNLNLSFLEKLGIDYYLFET